MINLLRSKTSMMSMNSGVIALIATILIWGSYFVALRSGAKSALTAFDMAILRFILPAIVLLPILIKSRKKILQVRKRYLLGITIGAGLPFYYISVLASSHVQAVVGSLLVPGVAPVFVTFIAIVFYNERLSKRRILGLGTILLGISILVLDSLSESSNGGIIGIIFYVSAAACWAVYTVSIKLAGLNGLELSAILNSIAAATLLIVFPTQWFDSNLLDTSWEDIYPQLLIMGVFCGFVSVITYGHAINKLGAELSACWGAVTPVVVSVVAFFVLHETIDKFTFLAMIIIILGVVIANLRKRKQY